MTFDPISKIIGKNKLVRDRYARNKLKCFKCGKEEVKENLHYWYHGDQDDLICTDCGKKTKHTDTAYAGLKVVK